MFTKIKTIFNLGLFNVFSVAIYRIKIRLGIHKVQRVNAESPQGIFFRPTTIGPPSVDFAELPWLNSGQYFGWLDVPANQGDEPPDWLNNPFLEPCNSLLTLKPWWSIKDFDIKQGDIKYIWEPSRFEWAVAFAIGGKNHNVALVDRLNLWVNDWNKNNPPYFGPNWKCAQEASIRVIRLVLVAKILDQLAAPEPALCEMIALHLARILPTLSYARAQQNNHATSEAAALLLGGAFLRGKHKRAEKYTNIGKRALENAVSTLVLEDGTFSQNSSNYHRFLIDTLTITEMLGADLKVEKCNPAYYDRVRLAIKWLKSMTDQTNGLVPNLGANDSAYLLPYSVNQSRDFRLSVGFAEAVFNGKISNTNESVVRPLLNLFKLSPILTMQIISEVELFDVGGFAILRKEQAKVLLRLPGFRFRPSHCDVLHVDFWLQHVNIFSDQGTTSYLSDQNQLPNLSLTQFHNTIQFDGEQQMPQISRFLFGSWLTRLNRIKISEQKEENSVESDYQDMKKRTHRRKITLMNGMLQIRDKVDGEFKACKLRWHLPLGNWTLKANELYSENLRIVIHGSCVSLPKLLVGKTALNYGDVSRCHVLEVDIAEPSEVITDVFWN